MRATVLAAQAPDVRVNQVTPVLFGRWPPPAELSNATATEVDEVISTLPLHSAKAANLVTLAQQLVARHSGEVPADLDELVALAGVGRKTAQVVLGACHGQPALPVDTHTGRLAVRLGFAANVKPPVVEAALRDQLPAGELFEFHLRLVEHGRDTCTAHRPRCGGCVLAARCPSAGL